VAAEGKNTPRCEEPNVIENNCGKWGDYINLRANPDVPNGWYTAVATAEDVDPKALPLVAVTFISFVGKHKKE
jgi:hypothetical protein